MQVKTSLFIFFTSLNFIFSPPSSAQCEEDLTSLSKIINKDFSKWRVEVKKINLDEIEVKINLTILKEWDQEATINHSLFLDTKGYLLKTDSGTKEIDKNIPIVFFQNDGFSVLKKGDILEKKIYLKQKDNAIIYKVITLGRSSVFSRIYSLSCSCVFECADYNSISVSDPLPKTISIGYKNNWPQIMETLNLDTPTIRCTLMK